MSHIRPSRLSSSNFYSWKLRKSNHLSYCQRLRSSHFDHRRSPNRPNRLSSNGTGIGFRYNHSLDCYNFRYSNRFDHRRSPNHSGNSSFVNQNSHSLEMLRNSCFDHHMNPNRSNRFGNSGNDTAYRHNHNFDSENFRYNSYSHRYNRSNRLSSNKFESRSIRNPAK